MSSMVNYNGSIFSKEEFYLNHENRGLRYGDALFETIRVVNGKVFFWEDHYLRLMASMRILRMEIPPNFTMEFLEKELQDILKANGLENAAARIRFTVFRNNGGLYLPLSNTISYIIEAQSLDTPFFMLHEKPYEIELFKDFYVNPDILSTLKTNNKIINVVGSIFAQENGYQSCLLLNTSKQIVEALSGNVFLVKGTLIKTPPLKDGCLNGILRKKLIEVITKVDLYTIEETSISPFELQQADELFITNAVIGLQPVTKYRKKEFSRKVATDLVGKLNALARLS